MLPLIPVARKDKPSREVTSVDPWLFHTESESFTDQKLLEFHPQSAIWLECSRLNLKDFG